MKIALAQMDVKQACFMENIEESERLIKNAATENAELIIFPEMFLSGFHYGKNLDFLRQNPDLFETKLSAFAKNYKIAISGSAPAIDEEGNVYNRLYFFSDAGEKLASYDKIHLFTLFNEHKHIKNGTELVCVDYKGIKFGLAVCYDLRFPEMFRKMTYAGVQAFILVAGWPHPRLDHWECLTKARAIENQAFCIAVNQAGTENFGMSDVNYFGASALIDPWGQNISKAKVDIAEIVFAELDISLCEKTRSKLNALNDAFFSV